MTEIEYANTIKLMMRGGRRVQGLIERYGADSQEVKDCLDRWSRIIRSNTRLLRADI